MKAAKEVVGDGGGKWIMKRLCELIANNGPASPIMHPIS